ncbi:MAG: hypothetical protein AAFP26_03315 [Planctomycetota bacterium]
MPNWLTNLVQGLLGNLPILIAISIPIIGVLSQVGRSVKEQKEKRRAAQLREQARLEAIRTGRASGDRQSADAEQPRPAQQNERQRRLEELAARRRAQLEELRRRRQANAQQQQTARQQQTRPQPISTRQPAQQSQSRTPVPPQAPPQRASQARPQNRPPVAAPAQIEAQTRAQRALQRARAQQARDRQPPTTPQQPSRPLGALRSTISRAPLSERQPTRVVEAESSDKQSLRAALATPGALRRAFLIREILDVPVSMRTPGQEPGAV